MADIDLLQDSLAHAQQRRDSVQSFAKSAIGQRIRFHQDLVALSILLLGGIVAIFNVSSGNLIKTSWLLYSAGGFLILCALICLYSRIKLIEHLQDMVAATEGRASKVYDAVRDLRSLIVRTNPPPTDAEKGVAVDKLINAENPTDNLPYLGIIAEKSHRWVAMIFSLSLMQSH